MSPSLREDGCAGQISCRMGMALQDEAIPENPSCRILSISKVEVVDSIASTVYRMKDELGP